MHWYRKTTEQALAELQVTPEGLSASEVQALKNGASLECARTQAVTTMVFFQFFQA